MTALARLTNQDDAEEMGTLGKGFYKIEKAAAVYLASKGIYASGKKIYDSVQARRTYAVTVYGTDFIYPHLHQWVLDRLPDEKRRALVAESVRRSNTTVGNFYGIDGSTRSEVTVRYDGRRNSTVDVDGFQVEVSIMPQQNIPSELKLFGMQRDMITMVSKSRGGRDAVLGLLNELLKVHTTTAKVPVMFALNPWGDWRMRKDLPLRAMDSVVLRRGRRDILRNDLKDFLDSEEFYNERSIPWHRGYLFYGPPGTGKTSTARALASDLGLDLYYMSLGDLKADADILKCISEVPERSVLLLEDVDVFHIATSREEDGVDTPSLSGLLNALDGVSTPHGLVTIMTTNDIDVLDPALIRAGRIDHKEFFDLADQTQAKQIFEWFYRKAPTGYILPSGRHTAPSDLISMMYQHKNDPNAAEEAIRKS